MTGRAAAVASRTESVEEEAVFATQRRRADLYLSRRKREGNDSEMAETTSAPAACSAELDVESQ